MSVTEDSTLPNQPTDGFVEYLPLGGDGFRTPSMMCNVFSRATGDASAGTITVIIRIDPVFLWVPSWIEARRTAAAAAAVVDIDVTPRQSGLLHQSVSKTVDTEPVVFTPAPIMLEQIDDGQVTMPRFSCDTPNVNGENLTLSAQLFAFNKRAREFGFTRDIFSTVSRGSHAIS